MSSDLSKIPECPLPDMRAKALEPNLGSSKGGISPLSDMRAKALEPNLGLSKGGISLFNAKRRKQNGFFASCREDHTLVDALCVASKDSLPFSSKAPISSSCHVGTSSTCMNVGANNYAVEMYVESTQPLFPAVAPHNQPSLDLASAADTCTILLEKVRLEPTEASRFQKDYTHIAPCKPGDLSHGPIETDPELFSSSEASPSFSP